MSYKIGIIGTGYVGLVSGTSFAASGNEVYCIDIDEDKIAKLRKGISPIFEPGLDYYLKQNIREGRLHFSTILKDAVSECSIIFLCLPTPPNEDGSADLHHVLDTAKEIAEIMLNAESKEKKIVVNKSTVPVGTGEKVQAIFDAILGVGRVVVVSNPEFLREGFAIEDAMKPERVVIGTSDKWAEELMRDLYEPFVRSGNPIIVMDVKSAEVTKYASNAFLATKISFMNDLSLFCEVVGADIEKIRIGMGSDSRIGKRFLFAGIGFGGSCFPKDVRALLHTAEEHNIDLVLPKAAFEVNRKQMQRFVDKIVSRFGRLNNRKFAVWGLAFKPNTDDTREAPAFYVIEKLLLAKARVCVYDPEAIENARLHFGDRISYSSDMYSATKSTDALVIVTEWNVFRNPNFFKLKELLKNPIIFDGRNLFNPEEMKALDFEYYCIGREQIKKG